jgi:hypothetical protein
VVLLSEPSSGFGRDYITRLMRGIMKLILASFIISAVGSIDIPDIQMGNATLNGALFKAILQFVVPLAIIISALRDMGVDM